MIVVAEAVAANAAAIAIWLMSRARFGRPLVGVVVNFTVGGGLSSCVIRGDRVAAEGLHCRLGCVPGFVGWRGHLQVCCSLYFVDVYGTFGQGSSWPLGLALA